MGAVKTYQLTITPAMLDGGDGRGSTLVEVPSGGTVSRVVSVRAVAPELTGLTTGDSSIALAYRVGDPPALLEAWAVTGDTNGAAIGYTPATYEQAAQNARGDYRVSFGEGVPLYVRYANTSDVALPSDVRVDVVVEHE